MNFPNTEIEAPEAIYLFDVGDDIVWCQDSSPEPAMTKDDEIKYIRDDVVTKMMRSAFVMGRQDRVESPYSKEAIKAAISEIRRRYAACNSD